VLKALRKDFNPFHGFPPSVLVVYPAHPHRRRGARETGGGRTRIVPQCTLFRSIGKRKHKWTAVARQRDGPVVPQGEEEHGCNCISA